VTGEASLFSEAAKFILSSFNSEKSASQVFIQNHGTQIIVSVEKHKLCSQTISLSQEMPWMLVHIYLGLGNMINNQEKLHLSTVCKNGRGVRTDF